MWLPTLWGPCSCPWMSMAGQFHLSLCDPSLAFWVHTGFWLVRLRSRPLFPGLGASLAPLGLAHPGISGHPSLTLTSCAHCPPPYPLCCPSSGLRGLRPVYLWPGTHEDLTCGSQASTSGWTQPQKGLEPGRPPHKAKLHGGCCYSQNTATGPGSCEVTGPLARGWHSWVGGGGLWGSQKLSLVA